MDLQLESNSKSSLVNLWYSEYLIRSEKNKEYREILFNSDFTFWDGKGVFWLKEYWYSEKPLSIAMYPYAFFDAIWFSINFRKYQDCDKLVLGRDYIKKLLNHANRKSRKVAFVGSFDQSQIEIIKTLYPFANHVFFDINSNSKTMQDGLDFNVLSKNNLFEIFPEFLPISSKIIKERFDLVVLCLGGSSGKQEFLGDFLSKSMSDALIVGIGAALDQFKKGGGQIPAPQSLVNIGLEPLWRIFFVPKRAYRILKSIFGLVAFALSLENKEKYFDKLNHNS